VIWSWDLPVGVPGIGFVLQQTDEIDSESPTENGFASSSEKTVRGVYSYQFTEIGTFYYWSGPVNDNGVLQ